MITCLLVGYTCCYLDLAVGQNQWYHVGVGAGAPPILVVHWGYDLAFDPWPFAFGGAGEMERQVQGHDRLEVE